MATQWKIEKVLGSGTYGIVYLATFPTLPPIAIKSSVFSKSASLQREKIILQILKGCPEIIRCFGFEEMIAKDEKYSNLFLEYAPGGTLEDLIKKRGGKLSEPEVRVYSRMILKGLHYIHEKGFVHCDIKPANILVFPTSSVPCRCGVENNRVKIADFGLAKRAGKGDIFVSGGLDDYRGTPLYTSPESVALGLNEAPMDIWSLGCVMVEMLTGKPVWSNIDGDLNDLLFEIGFGGEEEPEIPEGFSANATDFLIRCLVREPSERWTAKMLLNHPFMVEHQPLPSSLKKASKLVQHHPFNNRHDAELISSLLINQQLKGVHAVAPS
ncbi:mitogen-activated protein kinase kinase kinase 20-like [Cornus florida]|uniref:mitogen-activated protein kinase kinase kinase 20-like n=1 Tax=Cornus florida TaxID=4283 RepID=UPI0028976690|nr:mitogen-activated protein kinase kinase kinase 20-like [Cornus florida]